MVGIANKSRVDLLSQNLRILSISRGFKCLVQWKGRIPWNGKVIQRCVQQCLERPLSASRPLIPELVAKMLLPLLSPRMDKHTFSASFFPIIGLILPNASLKNSMP